MKGLIIRYRKTELMSAQWEIDLILNMWFTYIRLKLSCTIQPHTLIKSKIVTKYVLKNIPKHVFFSNFQFSKILVQV